MERRERTNRVSDFPTRRLSRRQVLTGALAIGADVSIAAVCGGSEKQDTKSPGTGQGQAVATRVVETASIEPTQTLVPAIATVEPSPTKEAALTAEEVPALVEEIRRLIHEGFVGLTITPEQVPEDEYRSLQGLDRNLDNCVATGTISEHGETWEVNHPNWRTVRLGSCGDIGRATKKLYGLTENERKDRFLLANQLMKRLHRWNFEQLKNQGEPIGDDYWQHLESTTYSLSPAEK